MYRWLGRPCEPEERYWSENSSYHSFLEVFFWRRFPTEPSGSLAVQVGEVGRVENCCDDYAQTHPEER